MTYPRHRKGRRNCVQQNVPLQEQEQEQEQKPLGRLELVHVSVWSRGGGRRGGETGKGTCFAPKEGFA